MLVCFFSVRTLAKSFFPVNVDIPSIMPTLDKMANFCYLKGSKTAKIQPLFIVAVLSDSETFSPLLLAKNVSGSLKIMAGMQSENFALCSPVVISGLYN